MNKNPNKNTPEKQENNGFNLDDAIASLQDEHLKEQSTESSESEILDQKDPACLRDVSVKCDKVDFNNTVSFENSMLNEIEPGSSHDISSESQQTVNRTTQQQSLTYEINIPIDNQEDSHISNSQIKQDEIYSAKDNDDNSGVDYLIKHFLKSNHAFKIEPDKDGLYPRDLMLNILKTFYEMKYPTYEKLALSFRNTRRKLITTPNAYFTAIINYFFELKRLFHEDFDQLIFYNIIDNDIWEKSLMCYENLIEEIDGLIFSILEEWEKKIVSKKALTLEDFCKINDIQINLIKEEIIHLESSTKFIEGSDSLITYLFVLHMKFADIIYEEYDIELEDILNYISRNSNDERVLKRVELFEENVQNLTQKLEDKNNIFNT